MELDYDQTEIAIQPPRPPNCFMVWAQEKRKEIATQNMIVNNSSTSVLLGKIWESMSDKDKQPYKLRADLLKHEHKLKYPTYKYQPKKKVIKGIVKDKENVTKNTKIRKIKPYTKKEKLIKKNIIIKEINLNMEEPDYFSEIQMHFEYIKETKETRKSDYFIEDNIFYDDITYELY